MKFQKTTLLLLPILLLFSYTAKAQHPLGSDISWICLGNDSFEITVNFYADCAGTLKSFTRPLYVHAGTKKTQHNINFQVVKDITPSYNSCTKCSNLQCGISHSFVLFQAKKTVYLDPKNCNYKFSVSQYNRIKDITTGGAGFALYIEAEINTCLSKCNNSVIFKNPPLSIARVNECIEFSPLAIDQDQTESCNGDSLVFYLSNPLEDAGLSVRYNSPYSYKEPLRYNGAWGNPTAEWSVPQCRGFHLDSADGTLNFKAIKTDVTPVVFTVEEWRKDSTGKAVRISRIMRDNTLYIIDDVFDKTHNPRISMSAQMVNNNYIFHPGFTNCITISTFDIDNDSSVIEVLSGLPKNSTFKIDKTKKNQTATFCWKPDSSQICEKPIKLLLQAQDNHQGINGRIHKINNLVVRPCRKPKANFEPQSYQLPLNSYTVFTNTSIDTNKNAVYTWYFGNGDTSIATKPSYRYIETGEYEVMLVAKSCNFSDTVRKTIKVVHWPRPNFSIDNAVCKESITYFSNLSVVDSGTLSYFWNFGDGNTSTDKNPSHIFDDTGNFTVKLHAKTANGYTDSISKIVKVLARPVAAFSINNDVQCITGNSFYFKNESGILYYNWDFGDGTTSTNRDILKSYNNAGEYFVKLKVKNFAGCEDSMVKTITVQAIAVADFEIVTQNICMDNNYFIFKNKSVNTNKFYWQFGDGATSTEENPVYSYSKAGKYTVTLKAGMAACATEKKFTVEVFPSPKLGNITGNSQPPQNSVEIYSVPNQSFSSYYWVVSGGTITAGTNSHSATVEWGSGTIGKLTAYGTDENLCKDSVSLEVHLQEPNAIVDQLQRARVQVYPIPSGGILNLHLDFVSANINLRLHNMLGQQVWAKQLQNKEGNLQYQMKFENLRGIYFLQIETTAGNYVAKVIFE